MAKSGIIWKGKQFARSRNALRTIQPHLAAQAVLGNPGVIVESGRNSQRSSFVSPSCEPVMRQLPHIGVTVTFFRPIESQRKGALIIRLSLVVAVILTTLSCAREARCDEFTVDSMKRAVDRFLGELEEIDRVAALRKAEAK